MKQRIAVIFVCLFIFGLYMLIDSGNDSRQIAKGMLDFNYMTVSDFEKGRFVQGTVYEFDDEFAYEEEYRSTFGIKHGERVSAHYYAMPLVATLSEDESTTVYVAVKISNSGDAATAQQMVDETYEYYETGEELDWTELDITGKIVPLDKEIKGYFEEWIDYWYNGEGSYDRICPYMIECRMPQAASDLMIAGGIMMAVGAAGIAVFIAMYFRNRQPVTPAPSYNYSPAQPPFPEQTNSAPQHSYNPVSAPSQPQTSEPVQEPKRNYYADAGSMDDIDTSSLGIGIDDEE